MISNSSSSVFNSDADTRLTQEHGGIMGEDGWGSHGGSRSTIVDRFPVEAHLQLMTFHEAVAGVVSSSLGSEHKPPSPSGVIDVKAETSFVDK